MSLLTGLVLALTAAPLDAAAFDQTQVYRFKAMLGDREIGEHRFSIGRDGDSVHVRSEADFAVKFLLFKAFGYEHVSNERYDAGCLTSLASTTQTGGERFEVNVLRDAEGLAVSGGEAAGRLEGCVSTFAYWDPVQLLNRSRLLNPQTGKLVDVTITPLSEPSSTPAGSARVFEISGDEVEISVFYSAADESWVGLETNLGNGRVLRYVPLAESLSGAAGGDGAL